MLLLGLADPCTPFKEMSRADTVNQSHPLGVGKSYPKVLDPLISDNRNN